MIYFAILFSFFSSPFSSPLPFLLLSLFFSSLTFLILYRHAQYHQIGAMQEELKALEEEADKLLQAQEIQSPSEVRDNSVVHRPSPPPLY